MGKLIGNFLGPLLTTSSHSLLPRLLVKIEITSIKSYNYID